jgi:hypothetical protein
LDLHLRRIWQLWLRLRGRLWGRGLHNNRLWLRGWCRLLLRVLRHLPSVLVIRLRNRLRLRLLLLLCLNLSLLAIPCHGLSLLDKVSIPDESGSLRITRHNLGLHGLNLLLKRVLPVIVLLHSDIDDRDIL